MDTAPSRARCSAGKAREATRYQRNVGERAFGEDNAPFSPTSTSEASSRRDTESSRTAWECGRSVPRRGLFIFDNRIREHADIGRVDRGRRRSRPTRDREARQRPSARPPSRGTRVDLAHRALHASDVARSPAPNDRAGSGRPSVHREIAEGSEPGSTRDDRASDRSCSWRAPRARHEEDVGAVITGVPFTGARRPRISTEG